MKKIVQRTKGFEKAFLKLQPQWRKKFIKQAIYRKEFTNEKTMIIFTFIDIGSHSRVY